jgi:hypothetical protein
VVRQKAPGIPRVPFVMENIALRVIAKAHWFRIFSRAVIVTAFWKSGY